VRISLLRFSLLLEREPDPHTVLVLKADHPPICFEHSDRYAEEASRAGLNVNADDIRRAFKPGKSPRPRILFAHTHAWIAPWLPLQLKGKGKVRLRLGLTQYISLLHNIVHMVFQTAFKALSSTHPQNPQNTSPNPSGPNTTGTTTPPLDPTRWWTLLIEGCMRGAEIPDAGQSIGIISLGLPFLFSRFQVERDSCSVTKLIMLPPPSLPTNVPPCRAEKSSPDPSSSSDQAFREPGRVSGI
jgi:hypothetical protein